jgi:hypothetical protein
MRACSGAPAQFPWRGFAFADAGSTTISDSVFHAPQASHWPCHFE